MEPILLVHGAWHGAWCWSQLVSELEARGRRVLAIDLPAAGADTTPLRSVTMDDYVETILAALRTLGEPATVVAHSFGGMSMTAAAEAEPDLFARLVYLAAYVPLSGESTFALLGRLSGHGVDMPEPTPNEDGSGLLAGEEGILAMYSGCADDDIATARKNLVPLPMAVAGAPVVATTDRAWRIPRTYVECTEDTAFSIEKQRVMSESAQPLDVVSLESGHSPFYTVPVELARILAAL